MCDRETGLYDSDLTLGHHDVRISIHTVQSNTRTFNKFFSTEEYEQQSDQLLGLCVFGFPPVKYEGRKDTRRKISVN